MSPQHGFLHRPTDYPSLVYDLIEPYRYISEEAVAQAIQQSGVEDKNLTISSLNLIKQMMEETVYVPATRQKVRRKNLLHGAVLAMRAWLLGDMARLVIPEEGVSKGGRPPKVSYTLPGERSKNERRRVAPS
jgi:CRISPR/Cas system-associated endonuclease Cas1